MNLAVEHLSRSLAKQERENAPLLACSFIAYEDLKLGEVVHLGERMIVVHKDESGIKFQTESGSLTRLTPEGFFVQARRIVDILESSINFPRSGLSPAVWQKAEGKYVLQPGVKERILAHLDKYPGLKLREVAVTIHLVGSIGSNQYEDGSDIDVHVVPDLKRLAPGKSAEDWQKDVKHFNKTPAGTSDKIGTHPIEIYLQLNPVQDYLSVSVYDLLEEKWVIGPSIVPLEFNPYEAYEEMYDELQDMIKGTDIQLGELKRDVIDYFVIRDAMRHLPPEIRAKLRDQLTLKLEEVEKDIDELLKEKEEWVEMRKKASAPLNKEQALKDIALVKKWGMKNALFKLLARYEYLKVITDLEDLLKDDELDHEEMSTVKQILGV